jgi:hypothetical protein
MNELIKSQFVLESIDPYKVYCPSTSPNETGIKVLDRNMRGFHAHKNKWR